MISYMSSGPQTIWMGLPFVVSGAGAYGSIGFDVVGEQINQGVTTFAVFDDANNKPNNELASVVVHPSRSSIGPFGGSFAGLTLTAGQTYCLVGKTTATQVPLVGNTTNTTGTYYQHFIDANNSIWFPPQTIGFALPAFDITGIPLPEPGTPMTAAMGLAITALLRRR